MTKCHTPILSGPTRRPFGEFAPGLLVLNDAKPPTPAGELKPWFRVVNDGSATAPAEIQIYDRIGRGIWDDSGIADRDFAAALNAIPRGREITLRINSPGGSVKDGLAIHNLIAERRNDITTVVDGIAASVASWLPLAGKKVIMAQNSQMMIHNPMTMVAGDARELRKAAEFLDTNKAVIVGMYRTKTGKSENEIARAMDDETWFTANEAKAWGLADEVGHAPANIQNTFDLSCFRRVPEALTKLAATKPPENTPTNSAPKAGGANDSNRMDKVKLIALLKEQGIEVANEATDEQIAAALKQLGEKAKATPPENKDKPAATNVDVEKLTKTLDTLTSAFNALQAKEVENRKRDIGAELDRLVENNQMGANEREGWLELCINDASGKTLNNLKARPAQMPGAEPVHVAVVELTNEAPSAIAKAWNRFNEPGNSFCRGNGLDPKNLGSNSLARARFFAKNRARMLEVFNDNSFDAGLQRQVVLQESIRAFAKVLAPLRGFATTFANVPLQGTAKIDVPYYPLATAASTDFVQANGYVMGDTTVNTREITVDKRKYQPIRFNSNELRRQPFIDLSKIATIKAEKLAIDVFQNILSVVLIANYALAKSEGAATFDLDDVADIRTVCNQANWPQMARILVLDSAYDGNLFKQDGLQRASEYGGTEVIRGGLVTRLMGFEYHQTPNIPVNGQNLTGFAAFMSAILVGLSPIEPAAEVRQQLTSYQVFTDAEINVSFENRVWGNPDSDERREVIEANYGFMKGEGDALKRVVSAGL